MQTVCELASFTRDALAAGLTREEIEELTDYLARNPEAGEAWPGTGGCRKLRWGMSGRGKRGGSRIITFFSGDAMPVFLVTVFAKGERATLTAGELNDLRKLTKLIVAEYKERMVPVKAERKQTS